MAEQRPGEGPHESEKKISRRTILKYGGSLALASAAAPLIAACGGGDTAGVATSQAGAAPSPAEPTMAPPVATTNVGAWQPRFKEQATVSRFGFGTDNTTAKVRVQAFQAAYPNITLQAAPEIDDQKILTAIASGDVPDLFWLGRDSVLSWAARDALEPLDDLIKNDDRFKADNFYESAMKEVQYEGQTWAIPQFMDARPLWLNVKPLREAGIKPEDIDTSDWAKLQEYGKQLTKKNGNKYSRWGFDTKVQDGFLWMYSWGNGGNLISEDGKTATFDSAENVEALKYAVETMNQQGPFREYKAFSQTWGFEGESHPFIQNQVAITPYESWLMGIIAEGAPKHEFVTKPFTGKDGKPVSLTGGQAWAIPKGAKNKEAAWEFIAFMSDANIWKAAGEAQKKEVSAEKKAYIPSFTANKEADRLLQTEVYEPITPAFDNTIKMIPQLFESSKQVAASPVIKELKDILTNEVVNPTLEGSKQPEGALKDGQAKAQAALDKFYK